MTTLVNHQSVVVNPSRLFTSQSNICHAKLATETVGFKNVFWVDFVRNDDFFFFDKTFFFVMIFGEFKFKVDKRKKRFTHY